MGPFTALMSVDQTVGSTETAKGAAGSTIAGSFGGLIERMRRNVADHRLRDQLADMDDAMLRDIGVAADEIHQIRSRNTFTPRAWADRLTR